MNHMKMVKIVSNGDIFINLSKNSPSFSVTILPLCIFSMSSVLIYKGIYQFMWCVFVHEYNVL